MKILDIIIPDVPKFEIKIPKIVGVIIKLALKFGFNFSVIQTAKVESQKPG